MIRWMGDWMFCALSGGMWLTLVAFDADQAVG